MQVYSRVAEQLTAQETRQLESQKISSNLKDGRRQELVPAIAGKIYETMKINQTKLDKTRKP